MPFAFLQSSNTSPSCHNQSKITKHGLTMASKELLQQLWAHPIGAYDLTYVQFAYIFSNLILFHQR